MALPSLSRAILFAMTVCSVFLLTPAAVAEENSLSPVDEIVAHLAGRHARVFVLDDGRIVIQTGYRNPNDPKTFAVIESLGFAPETNTGSLSVVVNGKDKVLDVAGQYVKSLSGAKDVSVIELSGEGNKSVVEFEGSVDVEELVGHEAVRVIVENAETYSTLSFSFSTKGLVFEDVRESNGEPSEVCCRVHCDRGDCYTGSNCIICSCFCGLFDEPWCICWLYRVIVLPVALQA